MGAEWLLLVPAFAGVFMLGMSVGSWRYSRLIRRALQPPVGPIRPRQQPEVPPISPAARRELSAIYDRMNGTSGDV